MITLAEKSKIRVLSITLAVATALLAGCAKEPAAEENETALASPEDLFKQPLQPHPLALAAEDVVVTVNGEKVTHGEILEETQMTLMQMSRQIPPQQLAQMSGQIYENVKDSLIAKILLTKQAETSGLAVSDAELNKEIETISSQAPEGTSLKQMLAENEIDFDQWKEELRGQMLVRKLIDEQTAGVAAATAAEAAEFYQSNIERFKIPEAATASHILLSFTPEDTDVTKAVKKKDLEKIRAEILAGADFAELAQKHSDCPSKQRGGSLGTFMRGQMVPEFEQVAFSQEPGTVSDIVETQFGYHLIKVTDHQAEGIRSLTEVSDQISGYLTNQKKQEVLMAYIDGLKAKAAIEHRKQDLDAAAE